jgi:hypothetical protein
VPGWRLPPATTGKRPIEATLDKGDRWKVPKTREGRKRLDRSIYFSIAVYRPDWTYDEIQEAVEESRWEGGEFSEERKRLITELEYFPSAAEIDAQYQRPWWVDPLWIVVLLGILWWMGPIPLASLDARSLALLPLLWWLWTRK